MVAGLGFFAISGPASGIMVVVGIGIIAISLVLAVIAFPWILSF
jgi:hypothetical protein